MTVTPEARSTAVFSRGMANGFSAVIPVGGQEHPSSVVGASLLWKKAQKKAKKKRISETMNRIIPHRSPPTTPDVWNPIKVLSRVTSRHHCSIVRAIVTNPKSTQSRPYPWNHEVSPTVSIKAPTEPVRGQGLYSTR